MAEQNSTVKNVDAEEGKFGQAGLLDPNRSGSGGPSVNQLRGSRASISAPTKERVFNPHAQNPARIPTAGGVAVGSKQYQARRASRVSQDLGSDSKSPPQSPPPVMEEPAESSVNGAASGGGAPAFNIPSYDDKNAVAPDAQAAGGAPAETTAETTTTTTAPATEDKSTTEKVKETVKDKLPGTTGDSSLSPSSPTSPASPSKERRGSRFEAFKGKLGIGK